MQLLFGIATFTIIVHTLRRCIVLLCRFARPPRLSSQVSRRLSSRLSSHIPHRILWLSCMLYMQPFSGIPRSLFHLHSGIYRLSHKARQCYAWILVKPVILFRRDIHAFLYVFYHIINTLMYLVVFNTFYPILTISHSPCVNISSIVFCTPSTHALIRWHLPISSI